MSRDFGYACINLDIGGFKTYRLDSLKLPESVTKIKEVMMYNLKTTALNIKWNIENGIGGYRFSSELFPLVMHPEYLKWERENRWYWYKDNDILSMMDFIYELCKNCNIITSSHPGQYTVLNSNKNEVMVKSFADLGLHFYIMDRMSCYGNHIIVHIGGKYGDKENSKIRFIENINSAFSEEKERIKQLLIENDDKSFNFKDAVEVAEAVGALPIFDYHHNKCLPTPDIEMYLEKAIGLWKRENGYIKVHVSSGKNKVTDVSHADYVKFEHIVDCENLIRSIDKEIPILYMLEAKAKNRAVLDIKQRESEIKWNK